MIEIPESTTLASQLTDTVTGKTVRQVVANQAPRTFVWFYGDPAGYDSLLAGRKVDGAYAVAGYVELAFGNARLHIHDDIRLHFHPKGDALPDRHQLLLMFEDGSALSAVVLMYGGMAAFYEGGIEDRYYLAAQEKPSPLSDVFDEAYFASLCACGNFAKLSAKAFLATEQRIPGLGNGVLQDILWRAKLHPRRKMGTLSDAELAELYDAVKKVLAEMTVNGGRDTERDLFGKPGGYRTVLSKNTAGSYCPVCGGIIRKEAYLGGSVYTCEGCQKRD